MALVFFLFLFIMIDINCNEVNGTKPILHKCCSEGKYIPNPEDFCKKLEKSISTDVDIYDKSYRIINESIRSVFDIVPARFRDKTFWRSANYYKQFNWYLTKESGLVRENPNTYDRFNLIDSDHFCYDYTINDRNETVPGFWVVPEHDLPSNHDHIDLRTEAMLISSVFLLIVLIVYALLPELRNLCGLILMAYVSSLLGAFVLLATLRINVQNFSENECIAFTCAVYFFFLATFCWMNVMSYDIWWTFRGYAKARPIHRRGEVFKFAMYSIYGYGLPLAMTIFLRVINDVDLTHVPWFIKPGLYNLGCFLIGGQKLVYLYIPMMILILSNWIFYFMSAFNVWRLSRGTAVLDSAAAGTPAAHRTHRQRFLVYLKLSVVMGLSWVLEVANFFIPSWSKVWWITDLYNLLIGVIIFFIFICKPKILRRLKKLFKSQNFKRWVPFYSTKSYPSSVDTSRSQETQTIQVCAHPNGPVYITQKF